MLNDYARTWPILAQVPASRLVLVLILVLGLFLAWIRRLKLPATAKIPGPWYLKLTTAVVKYHDFSGSKSGWVHNLHLRYGPVVQIGRNEVSFASYTSAKQIYSTGNKDFRKTDFYSLFEQAGHINLFTALDPHKHSEIRKKLADRYSNTTVLRSKVLDSITERADMFTKICAETKSADVYLYLHAYALDCVTSMLFHPYGTDSLAGKKDKEMVRLLSYANPRVGFFLRYYAPTIASLCLRLGITSNDTNKGGVMIHEFVQNCLLRGGHSEFTLASRFLGSNDFDMGLSVSECLDHIGAGIETTGDTLCWLMWELSQPKHKDKISKLRQELLSRDPSTGLDSLPYLGAVVQEALRLWAPGTLPLPRYVPETGRHIDGYFVPEDTIVGCTAYSMHRIDTSIFPDADEFLPERWLDSQGATDRQRLFFAFGLGARTCIGKHLAMTEMRACLNAVYSKYWTKPAHDMHSSMALDDQILTSRPLGMCCKLEFVPWGDETPHYARGESPSQQV